MRIHPVRISTLAPLAVGLAAALTGCESGPRSLRVSVLNESSVPLLISARAAGATPGDFLPAPNSTKPSIGETDGIALQGPESGEHRIEAGLSDGWRIPAVGKVDGGVAFQVRADTETPTPAAVPLHFIMNPPGPYTLRIRGSARGLELIRGAGPAADPNLPLPVDTPGRRYNTDIPPTNPSF